MRNGRNVGYRRVERKKRKARLTTRKQQQTFYFTLPQKSCCFYFFLRYSFLELKRINIFVGKSLYNVSNILSRGCTCACWRNNNIRILLNGGKWNTKLRNSFVGSSDNKQKYSDRRQ